MLRQMARRILNMMIFMSNQIAFEEIGFEKFRCVGLINGA